MFNESSLSQTETEIPKRDQFVLLTSDVSEIAVAVAGVSSEAREYLETSNALLTAEAVMRLKYIDELEHKLSHESKTGLLTGVAFESRVLAKRHGNRRDDNKREENDPNRSDYIFFADFDDFKFINDYLGEVRNDTELFVPATQAMKSSLREGDLISRWGGEEFAGYIHNVSHDEVLIALDRIQTAVNNTSAGAIRPTLSIGFTRYDADKSYDTVMLQAQEAEKAAKTIEGKNTIIDYEEVAAKDEAKKALASLAVDQTVAEVPVESLSA